MNCGCRDGPEPELHGDVPGRLGRLSPVGVRLRPHGGAPCARLIRRRLEDALAARPTTVVVEEAGLRNPVMRPEKGWAPTKDVKIGVVEHDVCVSHRRLNARFGLVPALGFEAAYRTSRASVSYRGEAARIGAGSRWQRLHESRGRFTRVTVAGWGGGEVPGASGPPFPAA